MSKRLAGVTPDPSHGRGRGRGWAIIEQDQQQSSAHSVGGSSRTSKTIRKATNQGTVAKFEEACEKIRKTTELFLKNEQYTCTYSNGESSSDDEEDKNTSSILNKVLSPYSQLCSKNDISRTENFLLDSVKSGANICLICISSIKKTEAIWSCNGCYCIFHLPCIQTWAKDSLQQQQSKQISNHAISWCCPKCRHAYGQLDCPTKYACFCGKVLDPEYDPWLIPHTCGQKCERDLIPFCGHKCLLLCHPGPCPPCPKMVTISCHCGRQKALPRRCSNQLWSCGKPCRKLMSCGQHQCKEPCHKGICPICPKISVQSCFCGKEKRSMPCEEPAWHCTTICNHPLVCGYHKCEEVCHSGKCTECPRSKERSCPCGKNIYKLPCLQDIPTCGDTCGKPLACGIHTCAQRCHTGACGMCLQMTNKECRCKQKTKSMPCHKEYLCEIKCKQMRNCGRHLCNRKCCDGNCPLCEQSCGKMLRCRNHKCNSPCHQGPCYPCPLMAQVACRCGGTTNSVPCGMEKDSLPPKCSIPCQTAPVCHHVKHIPAHRCHFGLCPPCRQPCNQLLKCSHICPQSCHTNVLTKIEVEQKRAGPWEPKIAPRMEHITHPCPPCKVPVPVTCLGNHETEDLPCSKAIPSSCGKPCGRKLQCKNHTCALLCHRVLDAASESSSGSNCAQCDAACSLARPEGCPHPCLKTCHPAACPPCRQMVQQRCLCGLSVQYVPCIKWTSTSATLRRQLLLSCGDQCPKMMGCGHRCALLCHEGFCSPRKECQKRVTLKCACKRLKKDFLCSEVQQQGRALLQCNTLCIEKQENDKKLKEAAESKQKHEEMKRNEEEVEKLRRKLEGKRRKPRKDKGSSENVSTWNQHRIIFLFGFVMALAAILIYYFCYHY